MQACDPWHVILSLHGLGRAAASLPRAHQPHCPDLEGSHCPPPVPAGCCASWRRSSGGSMKSTWISFAARSLSWRPCWAAEVQVAAVASTPRRPLRPCAPVRGRALPPLLQRRSGESSRLSGSSRRVSSGSLWLCRLPLAGCPLCQRRAMNGRMSRTQGCSTASSRHSSSSSQCREQAGQRPSQQQSRRQRGSGPRQQAHRQGRARP